MAGWQGHSASSQAPVGSLTPRAQSCLGWEDHGPEQVAAPRTAQHEVGGAQRSAGTCGRPCLSGLSGACPQVLRRSSCGSSEAAASACSEETCKQAQDHFGDRKQVASSTCPEGELQEKDCASSAPWRRRSENKGRQEKQREKEGQRDGPGRQEDGGPWVCWASRRGGYTSCPPWAPPLC